MSDTFRDLIHRLQDNLISVIAVFLMVVILFGYVYFTANSILPQWRLRGELINRVSTAEEDTILAQQIQDRTFDTLKDEVETSQIRYEDAASFFITESEADKFVSSLYIYASDSHVEIAELQTQSTPNPEGATLYNIKRYRIIVQGNLAHLLDFLAKVREASKAGYILSDLIINKGESNDKLSMNVSLYTSPFAKEDLSEESINANSIIEDKKENFSYIVQSGDTLLSIAIQFNVPMSLIRVENELTTSLITPEQVLRIPN